MISYLEFEKPIAALDARIAELRDTAEAANLGGNLDIASEVQKLEAKSAELLAQTYRNLTPWQKTQVARHPSRPHFRDYVARAFSDFVPLGGDRCFGEDQAIIGGLARLGDRRVMLIGHEKGNDTQSRIRHNFGMGKPEGYRKAVRLMEMASRFGLPVVTLVDTSGAFPGVEAEERGQAEAIARSIDAGLSLKAPFIATIIGEGGSGGALAIGVCDQMLMLQFSAYSVISPEGCASILWKTSERAADAAEALGITAHRLKALGLIDKIVNEPVGGAHRDPKAMASSLKRALGDALRQVADLKPKELLARRQERLMAYGRFSDTTDR